MNAPIILAILPLTLAQTANLYPTIPGTDTPDRSRGYALDGDMAYPFIKGTSTPDRGSRQGFAIEDNKIYRTIPGTSTPDRCRSWRKER